MVHKKKVSRLKRQQLEFLWSAVPFGRKLDEFEKAFFLPTGKALQQMVIMDEKLRKTPINKFKKLVDDSYKRKFLQYNVEPFYRLQYEGVK